MKINIKRQWRSWMWNTQRFGVTPGKLWMRLNPPTDVKVFCVSIPKAGTHLLERVLCLHPYLYRKVVRTLHGNNLGDYGGLERLLDSMRGCQILMSHLSPREDVVREIDARGIKCIFVIRDPRDVVVSRAFYVLANKKHYLYQAYMAHELVKDRIRLCIEGNPKLGVRSVKEVYDNYADWLDSAALVVRFEDLIGARGGGDQMTQVKTVDQIFQHLGIPLSGDEHANIVQKAFSDASPTFRKGRVSGWRNHFDAELKKLFKEATGETIIQYGYEEDDSW